MVQPRIDFPLWDPNAPIVIDGRDLPPSKMCWTQALKKVALEDEALEIGQRRPKISIDKRLERWSKFKAQCFEAGKVPSPAGSLERLIIDDWAYRTRTNLPGWKPCDEILSPTAILAPTPTVANDEEMSEAEPSQTSQAQQSQNDESDLDKEY